MANKLPSLAFLYALRRSILEDIQEKGGNASVDPDEMSTKGLTRAVDLNTYLEAVQKMIEAMASLRDFDKQPFTKQELKDLEGAAELEEAIHVAAQVSKLG